MPELPHGRGSARARVANSIRDNIAANDDRYRPGDKLPSLHVLANRHGVSTTAAREALLMLCKEGLVRHQKNGGFYVRHGAHQQLRGAQDSTGSPSPG